MQILNLRVGQKKSFCQKKSLIVRPLYNRYVCHIIVIKWSRICQNFIESAFMKIFFFKDQSFNKFLIIAARALRQGLGLIKNVFQSDFLGPYDIPHVYKCQAKNS